MRMKAHINSLALTLLVLSGAAFAEEPLNIKELCGDYPIVTDSENKIFRGEFKRQGVTLQTALVATPMKIGADKNRIVFYLWGKQPQWNIKEAGCVPAVAKWKTKTVLLASSTWRKNFARYTFTEDAMEAKVKYNSSRGATLGKVRRSEQ